MGAESVGVFTGIDHFFVTHLPSAILLTVLLVAIGIGVGKFLGPLLKDFFGRGSVNVTVGEGISRKEHRICIPDECPEHLAEQERSHRNEEEIKLIWLQFGVLRTELLNRLKNIEDGNQEILLALIDKGKIRSSDLSRKPR